MRSQVALRRAHRSFSLAVPLVSSWPAVLPGPGQEAPETDLSSSSYFKRSPGARTISANFSGDAFGVA